MARQVAILVSCDNCGAGGLDPDHGLVLALGNDAPRQMDLCRDCQVKLWGPIAKVYAEAVALPPKAAPSTPKGSTPMACPECGYPCPSRSSLRSHLTIQHGLDLGSWQYEKDHAVDGETIPVPFKCEQCRKAFVNRQGFAQHQRASHPDAA